MNDPRVLMERIRELALEEGFDHCGAAPVQRLAAVERFREWLERGYQGSMGWLERAAERRSNPGLVVPDARSVLVVTRTYWTGDPVAEAPDRGRISRYAWGDEYHDVMGEAIRRLYDRVRALVPASGRYYVDTGPVLEKAWAEAAGLGWIGKHTNLIRVGEGSWFFLGAIVLDVVLEYGSPARDHCGTCTACIDVCPTDAIVAPYVLDARRCISYLTIENRGPIPRQLRAGCGNHVFGCDDCQDVCPWNRFARAASGAGAFAPREANRAARLDELLALGPDEFRARFRGSPVKRAKHRGFLRNVAVAAGNSGDRSLVAPLIARLKDGEPLVRGHCAWALGRLGGPEAREGLREAACVETDEWVTEEIELALREIAEGPRRG